MRLVKNAAALICILILFSFTALATEVYIDGETVQYNDTTGYPFAENGTVLVPLYPTFEAFGSDAIFQDNPNGTVVIIKDGISVSCNTADKNFRRNGTVIPCEYGLVWRGGPLYVPSEIFSAFDAEVNIGGSGVVITRAENTEGRMGIFCASYDEAYRGSKYFGAKYEPQNGIYPGCISQENFVEGAKEFSGLLRKEAAAFTVFARAEDNYSEYESSLKYAAGSGKLVRLVLDVPHGEFDEEKTTLLAEKLEGLGARILLCPVCRKTNCENNSYDTEVFRTISEIFRENAPSVAMVWQISVCRAKDFQSLYPGDTYTDYVEISMCAHSTGDNEGLSYINAACGYKKPLLLSFAFETLTGATARFYEEYLEFCINLPLKYPQIKAVFFPMPDSSYDRGEYIGTLRAGIAGNSFIGSPDSVSDRVPYYFELGNNVTVPPSKIKLYSGFDTGHPEAAYVIYKINGQKTSKGQIKNRPYETEVDFSSYAGKSVTLQATVYDGSNKPFSQKTYLLNVSSKQSADTAANAQEKPHIAVYIVIIAAGLLGVIIVLKKINDIFC